MRQPPRRAGKLADALRREGSGPEREKVRGEGIRAPSKK